MIAKCKQCGEGHNLRPMRERRLEDFRCQRCGGALEPADLRWCKACGSTEEDIEIMPGVTMPNVKIPAVRYFVAPGTTHCPNDHPFQPVQDKRGSI
jgi:hypothetical protein